MKKENSTVRPAYWPIYLLVPVLVGLFAIQVQLGIPPVWHRVLQYAIFFSGFGALGLWVHSNQATLKGDPEKVENERPILVLRPPLAQEEIARDVRADKSLAAGTGTRRNLSAWRSGTIYRPDRVRHRITRD